MRKYTVETLKKENELFDRCYGINNADVERVNHLIDMIEKSRSVESIQTFDVVEYTNEYGEYFPKATVTMKEEEDIELCENAGIHLNIYDDELCGSASGGAFSHHKESEFVYKGTAVKTFWTWGNVGARAMVEFILPQRLIYGNAIIIKKCFPQKHMINIICLIENQIMIISILLHGTH